MLKLCDVLYPNIDTSDPLVLGIPFWKSKAAQTMNCTMFIKDAKLARIRLTGVKFVLALAEQGYIVWMNRHAQAKTVKRILDSVPGDFFKSAYYPFKLCSVIVIG